MRALLLAAAAFALVGAASAQPAPNPLAAQLRAAQAELAASPHARPEHLITAVAAAEGHSEVNVTAYRAAMALGAWALDAQDFDLAHRAWASALAHAVGSSPPAVLARNRARMGEAVTQIAQYAHAPSAAARVQAYESLQQAASELYPYALQEGAAADIAPFQATYAEAIGWRDYGRAADTPRSTAPMHDLAGAIVCPTTWHGNDDIFSSLYRAFSGPPGIVVFRVLTDNSGTPTSVDVAYSQPWHMNASVALQPYGPHDFDRMERVLLRLRVEQASGAPANCVMPHVLFQALVLGGEVRSLRPMIN
ncbi:MAG: hypothetical protein HY054_15910 [Proteobacteria bacterium]|nr:hypothetical protein [Pseudomonadota bacterium]